MSETVKVEFEKFSGFITEYASNISLGGMFIKTEQPQSIGSELRFEIVLSDGYRLVQGTGEVAWTRTETVAPDKPAGMGIRFHDLDDGSRELIDKMVYHRLMDGGKPFELERPTEEQVPAAEPVLEASLLASDRSDVPETPEPTAQDSVEAPPATHAIPEPSSQPEAPAPISLPDSEPELMEPPSAPAELPGMESLPSFDIGQDSSFSGFRNVLGTGPSTQVQPPPDLAESEVPIEEAAATVHLPLDQLAPELTDTPPEPSASVLGDIGLPDSDLPPIGHSEPLVMEDVPLPGSVSELPPDSGLSSVSLPEDFGGDPGPPPPPPSFSEPGGQELDDSLLSMDDGMLRGKEAELPDAPAEAFPQAPLADVLAPPAEAPVELWDDSEDEDEEEDWGPPPRRSLGRILVPVILVVLVAAALFFLRDIWMPMLEGEKASTESTQADEPASTPMQDEASAIDESVESPPDAAAVRAEPVVEEPTATSSARARPVAIPSEPEPDQPSASALTGIDRITWKAEPTGLKIILWADGRVSGSMISHHHLGGSNPRELLKVRGVSRPFAGGTIEVGDGRVVQIRAGYHQGDSGNEIHFVFDLSSDAITVREIDSSGSKITLVLN